MERLVVEQTYNHLGELKTGITFDILWTTADPNSVNIARQYLKSKADPEAAHAGVVNPYQGVYRHVILPKVATTAAGAADTAKRYYWGIASSQTSSFYLGIWERPHMIPPSAGNSDGEDVQTDKLLSPLWETIVEQSYKLQETLNDFIETICSQIQKWRGSETIIRESLIGLWNSPSFMAT